jgi:hypothetical protein
VAKGTPAFLGLGVSNNSFLITEIKSPDPFRCGRTQFLYGLSMRSLNMKGKPSLISFRVKNFKAVQERRTIKVTPLTVFIGNNGSGKSRTLAGHIRIVSMPSRSFEHCQARTVFVARACLPAFAKSWGVLPRISYENIHLSLNSLLTYSCKVF